MNIFDKLMNAATISQEFEGPMPGAMGKLLASIGIDELGPVQKGTPINVLLGNKKEHVIIPGQSSPAYTKEGNPVMAKDKYGRVYHVQDQYAVSKKLWRSMVNDQKRKAEGRWYSGAEASA